MNDAQLRRLEREGGGLLARYRAGLLEVAYPCAPDVKCPVPHGLWQLAASEHMHRCKCKGTNRVPADPEDLLSLLAFCGVEEARALVRYRRIWDDLPEWLGLLSRLCARLPARRVEVDCQNTKVRGEADWCALCSNTGKVHHDTDAEVWLIGAACVAAGRACVPAFGCGACDGCNNSKGFCTTTQQICKAIDAGEAWVEEPTPERLNAAQGARAYDAGPVWGWLFDGPNPAGWGPLFLKEAAEVLGEDRVRKIVGAVVMQKVIR